MNQHTLRQEPFFAAVAENHPLAAEQHIPLSALADEPVELWPQTMSPGYCDAVVAACRDAGLEPRLDEQAGSTVVRRLIVIADRLAQARGSTQRAPVHTAPPT